MMGAETLWLSFASILAGCVYGFSGFGAALIFMPLAVIVVEPQIAIAAMSVSALSSFVTLVPRAWGEADRRAALTMLGAALVTIPIGQWILLSSDTAPLRWAVSGIAFATLLLLLSGWRYHSRPGRAALLSVGGGVGLMGGATGLNGPLVILFQLGGPDEVARTRANTILVLTFTGLAYLPFLAAHGALTREGVLVGASQLVPYGAGALLGRRLFNPAWERTYRNVAYAIIAAAAILGLPIWGSYAPE